LLAQKKVTKEKGPPKAKLMALLPTSQRHMGPKAINFTPFWDLPARRD